MLKSHQKYISTADLAKFLGISTVAVFKRIKNGRIKATKIGRSYAIPHAYIKEQYPQYKLPLIEEGEYVSVPQAAGLLGISRIAVFKKIKKGQLEARKVGRHYTIEKSQLSAVSTRGIEEVSRITKDFLSVPELAEALGISRITIFKRIQKGLIKAKRVGRHYVIAREDIEEGVFPPAGAPKAENYLSVIDVAKRMGISRIAVFKKIKTGELTAIKIGRSYAVLRSEIDEGVEEG